MIRLLILCLCFGPISLVAQNDQTEIQKVLSQFLNGTIYNYPDSIIGAFYPKTKMFLANAADTVLVMTAEKYASLYQRFTPGISNGRTGRILDIEIVGNVAFAKLEVDIPRFHSRFYDLLLLKKIEDQWKIISKCTSSHPIPISPEKWDPRPTKKVIVDNLNHPWSMAFLSESVALIAEKDGDLLVVDLKNGNKKAIKGLPEDVATAITIDTGLFEPGIFHPSAHGQTVSFNAGWFQVLLDPNFEDNRRIYLSYAAEDHQRRSALKVIRGTLDNDTLRDVHPIFLAQPFVHGLVHYGGGMIFGPDGKLYITTGERNLYEYRNPDVPVAQDLKDPRGKIIRINPDGSIPDDNPDFGTEAVPGLFALGIRAAQGLTIDPGSNRIWFSEHGTIQGDELNILEAGKNYGWPIQTTGKYRTSDYTPPAMPNVEFSKPVFSWSQTVAPTGLTFYTGNEFPQWNGDLIVPGLSRGSLWRMTIENDSVTKAEQLFLNDPVRLRKVVQSPGGKLYVLTDEDNGKLILIENRP